MSHNSSRVTPYSIKTFNAVNAIKAAAAAVKNTKLYDQVRVLDLIASEFKVHKHCYQDFTHGFTSDVELVKIVHLKILFNLLYMKKAISIKLRKS